MGEQQPLMGFGPLRAEVARLRARVRELDARIAELEAARQAEPSDAEIEAWADAWAKCWNSVSLRLPKDVLEAHERIGIQAVGLMRRGRGDLERCGADLPCKDHGVEQQAEPTDAEVEAKLKQLEEWFDERWCGKGFRDEATPLHEFHGYTDDLRALMRRGSGGAALQEQLAKACSDLLASQALLETVRKDAMEAIDNCDSLQQSVDCLTKQVESYKSLAQARLPLEELETLRKEKVATEIALRDFCTWIKGVRKTVEMLKRLNLYRPTR